MPRFYPRLVISLALHSPTSFRFYPSLFVLLLSYYFPPSFPPSPFFPSYISASLLPSLPPPPSLLPLLPPPCPCAGHWRRPVEGAVAIVILLIPFWSIYITLPPSIRLIFLSFFIFFSLLLPFFSFFFSLRPSFGICYGRWKRMHVMP